MKPIAIVGGTGNYGQCIVKALRDKEIPVRVLSRNAVRAREKLGTDIEMIEGDVLDDISLQKLLTDVDGLIISISAFSRQLIKKIREIEVDAVRDMIALAEELEIPRVVYISVFDKPAVGVKIPFGDIKREVEEAFEQSALNYTILGAAPSMEIFFAMIRGEEKLTMTVPGGGPKKLPHIHPKDLGEVASQAVLVESLPRRRYRMVSPQPLSFPEAAERISKEIDQEVRFRKVPLLPIRIAAGITGIFGFLFPYVSKLLRFIISMNTEFTDEIIERSLQDYEILQQDFAYQAHTIEDYTRVWIMNR